MGYKISPFAEIDLQESVDWYASQQVGLDTEFLTEIGNTIQRINQNPESYEHKYTRKGLKIKQALTEQFPYIVLFFVNEASQLVVVIAIWHTARNPKKFKKRL